MNSFLISLVIAISLSMDAFSLALVYGLSINNNDKIKLSLIVGIFHFIMPILGLWFGNIISKYLIFDIKYFVSFIFFAIGIEMILSSSKENKDILNNSILGYVFFSFTVSIDSFSIGVGLSSISNNYILSSSIFAIVSGLFTYLGLYLGSSLKKIIGKLSTIIGGSILLIMALNFVLK